MRRGGQAIAPVSLLARTNLPLTTWVVSGRQPRSAGGSENKVQFVAGVSLNFNDKGRRLHLTFLIRHEAQPSQ